MMRTASRADAITMYCFDSIVERLSWISGTFYGIFVVHSLYFVEQNFGCSISNSCRTI